MGTEIRGVAAVTGSGSGIGKAVATKFASQGIDVALIDVDEAAIATVAQKLSKDFGIDATVLVADLSDREACRDVVKKTFDWKAPKYWVNNAGILRLSPAIDTSDQLFDSVMDTNFRSTFVLSVEFARRAIEANRPGSIVNISSIHAVVSEPNASVYTAAKGAIEASTRTFASEWASRGIRVNCVRPL